MRSRLIATALSAALLVASCSGADDTTSGAEVSTGPQPTTSVVTSTTAVDRPVDLAAPPSVIELLSDPAVEFPPDGIEVPATGFRTRVAMLGSDVGTRTEVLFWAVVPVGWEFEPGQARFTDGSGQFLEFYFSCDGECRPKAWMATLGRADGPLAQQAERFRARDGFGVFGGGSDPRGGYVATSRPLDDSVLYSHVAWNTEAPLFMGCNLVVLEIEAEAQNGYDDLCGAVVADWDTVVANAPDPAPIEQVMTPDTETLLADAIARRGQGQPLVIDEDGEFTVTIELPVDTAVSIGSFNTELDLATAESIFTELQLDAGCEGSCEAKDWEAELNRFDGLLAGVRATVDVDLDAPFDNGWVVAGQQGDDYRLRIVQWDDDATHFFQCAAELDEADVGLAPSIISMCVAAEPAWFD